MRVILDRLYVVTGALAALFLVAIAVLVLLSIGSRLAGTYIAGLSEYAGYCMAASSFLALAYTFRHGGHVRVQLLLQRAGGRWRRALELWCLAIAMALAGFLAWYTIKTVIVSIELGDVSEGADATPLWLPQLGMATGAAVLALAVADRLLNVLRGGALEGGASDTHD